MIHLFLPHKFFNLPSFRTQGASSGQLIHLQKSQNTQRYNSMITLITTNKIAIELRKMQTKTKLNRRARKNSKCARNTKFEQEPTRLLAIARHS